MQIEARTEINPIATLTPLPREGMTDDVSKRKRPSLLSGRGLGRRIALGIGGASLLALVRIANADSTMQFTDPQGNSREWYDDNFARDPNNPNRNLVQILDRDRPSFRPNLDFYSKYTANQVVDLMVAKKDIHPSKQRGYLVTIEAGGDSIFYAHLEAVETMDTTDMAKRQFFDDPNEILPKSGINGDGISTFSVTNNEATLIINNCVVQTECGTFKHYLNPTDGSKVGDWSKVVIQPSITPTPTSVPPTPTATPRPVPVPSKELTGSVKEKFNKKTFVSMFTAKFKTDTKACGQLISVAWRFGNQVLGNENPRQAGQQSQRPDAVDGKDGCNRTKTVNILPRAS